MSYIHAEEAAMATMAEGDPEQPVVMLNFLRYRDKALDGHGVDGLTGRQAYEIYGRAFHDQFHAKYGGTPIWMGRGHNMIIGPQDEDWDIVILVRYPTRRQFLGMFNDPEYKAIAPIRAAALADSRIMEMTQLLPKD